MRQEEAGMHETAYAFFRRVVPHCHPEWSVLDVGSLDVNGSLRELFDFGPAGGLPDEQGRPIVPGTYVGADMRGGPNVMVIANAHALPFADGSFDLVVSTSMLEHDDRPWVSVQEMGRVLRTHGLIAISV